MSKSAINEDRLFRNLPYFFSNPSKVTTELIQNAERSGADTATIEYRDGLLKVSDNGSGTSNPDALLVLAESDWDEKVMNNANPAGFGLFFLFSVSESVTVRSLFGELTIDCRRYMEDKTYREIILEDIIPQGKADQGFEVIAELKKDVRDHFEVVTKDLAYFPLSLSFNGEPIERKYAEAEFSSFKIRTEYLGNQVFIDPSIGLHVESVSDDYFERRLLVVWYGMAIYGDKHSYSHIVIDVKNVSPLTPQLPYRDKIQHNPLFHDFKEFVRKKIVEYCQSEINATDPASPDKRTVFDLMKIMSVIATQKEINALNFFYIKESEIYFDDEDRVTRMVKRDCPPVISEIITNLCITKHGVSKETAVSELSALVIPSGFITRRYTADKYPDWLFIEEKEYSLAMTCIDDMEYSGRFNWNEVLSMTCGDKGEIPVVAAVDGYYEGSIFYKGAPKGFWDISDKVFKMGVFSEDWETDSYDTQFSMFEEEVERDIMRITGRYDIAKLFCGLGDAGINHDKIASILINHEAKYLELLLVDGEKRLLKLS